jgi:hypothetical protein
MRASSRGGLHKAFARDAQPLANLGAVIALPLASTPDQSRNSTLNKELWTSRCPL